jgi:hypothetical protein
MMIQDYGRPFAANVNVNGIATVFDLDVESISAVNPLTVIFDGQVISGSATPQFSINYKYGAIAFYTPPMPTGAVLGVQGTTYDFFDDDEVAQAVTDAFNMHVADQDPLPVIDPVPGDASIPTVEEYLVSILAAVELLWYRATDASQQIDIETPEGVRIARSERYEQILKQIAALKSEYNQVSAALGIGLYRIQVLTLRRVSYTTNRYVPEYRAQEYNAPYTGFWPTAAPVGALVTLVGRWFTTVTNVFFAGVNGITIPAVFTISDDEHITATVPAGATTGQIGIQSPTGLVLTTAQFVVGQPPPFVLYGPEMVRPPIPSGL